MANIRDLKKDIDYLAYEVISDCFAAMSVTEDEKVSDQLSVIVADAVKLRNELFSRVPYRGDREKAGEVKEYYRKLRKDMIMGADDLFTRLSKVVSD
ncbi:MAG: hypothetical protein V2I34_01200 [Bacteroidales bacterium]|jgi:hypothetical protein|nr:hypothetical protein [Bacteroidales bacterium]